MKKAMIMEIQRYCIHDGPGIRTTIFFKGCHMSCKWCHNPESQKPSAEMLFYGERCIGCMACFSFCERAAHRMENGVHRMDLSLCEGCGRMNECGEGCPAGALRVCGQEMDAQELLGKVLADRDFYGKEGGVTCSGGEALLQEEFLLEFLPLCKEAGISTCLDTTLNVEWERIERLLPFTDLFLADIKFMDPERHGQYCGTDGVRTVENLYRLSDAGKPVILRMPLLAGINDTGEEAQERKRLLERLANVRRVDCFGVTGHGASKYRALQREFVPFNQGVDPQVLAEQMREKLRQNGMGERKHMIRLTFEKGVQEKAVCVCTDSDINFRMNQAPFENRGIRFSGSAFLFDGYSVWFEEAGERLKRKGDFSVSFLLAPYGYSGRGDGLFSLFDGERKEGFYVLITKQGKLQAGFGNGRMLFSFDSLEVRAALNAWNMVTVVYGQEAGWCDLYVNGSLANRKQFPRHMEIKWPEGRAYLGRYVDHVVCTEESPSGCFYGLMEELLLWGKALRADEVKELHNVRPTGETAEKLGLDRSVYEGDAQHPQYHLIPPGKWMNEPHGPLYYQGYYHIFYQANPHAPIWDHIQWGHMVSRDMVHWEDMPLALETDESLDPDGCWSGSSLVDKEGRPCIFYTAGNDRCFPNQFVAMAEAVIDGEKRLPVWKKCDRPAVTQTQGWLGEFRDPFVWLEDDTYFMLVGTGDADNGGGNAVLYSSDDRESWQCHGFFLDYDYGKNREAGHVFELPVLLPLKGEEGDVVCHIFLFCACQIEGDVVETYGFLGKWDPKGRNFSKFHEKAMLLDLGNGIFTGPSGFVTPDGRTVVFTIAQGKRGWKEEYYAGWAHNGGLPVELSVQNSELRIRPIRELSSLRRRELLRLADVSLEEAKEALAAFSGNMLWLRIRADARLLQVEAGDAQTKRIIYYDREAERFGVFDETGAEFGKYRGEEDRVEIGDELVCIEYFLDHSMIEAYLNEKKSITARNYIAGRKRRISLDGGVNRICELELWEMGPAYEK